MTPAHRGSPQRGQSKQRPWKQGDDDSASFGAWLRRQREVREIGLREIADATKISLRYLEAFEQDRFDVLPSGLFSRGFLRQYARYVGLDPDEVVNRFLGACQNQNLDLDEGEDDPAALGETEPVRKTWTSGLVLLVVALIVVVAAAAVAAFYWSRRDAGEASAETPGVAAPVAVPTTAQDSSVPGPGTADPDTPVTDAPTGDPAVEGGDEAAAPAPPLVAALTFSEQCWLEARVDGGRATQYLQEAGATLAFEAQDAVELTIGNPGAVSIEVNGRPYPLTVPAGRVARGIRIDRALAESLTGS